METLKELFNTQIGSLKESLNEVKEVNKEILSKVNKQEQILLRNTITVEDHKKRSDYLEAKHDEFVKAQRELLTAIQNQSLNIAKIELELKPIKAHVKSVTKVTNLIVALSDNKGLIIKIITFLTILFLSVYYGIEDFRGLLK